jgi:ABC-type enterochelin transport system permease subunit
MLPLTIMVSVSTSIAGPLYLASVMGVLIGRFANNLERTIVESEQRPNE